MQTRSHKIVRQIVLFGTFAIVALGILAFLDFSRDMRLDDISERQQNLVQTKNLLAETELYILMARLDEGYLLARRETEQADKLSANLGRARAGMEQVKQRVEDPDVRSLVDILLAKIERYQSCLLYTSPSPRDKRQSRMPSSA